MSTPCAADTAHGRASEAAAGTAALSCRCGAVRGHVTGASPRSVNRAICYCDDCQAFAHYLGRPDLLDPRGGSDIVQVAPASLTFVQGQQNIRGVRLARKGLHRWHTSCCNTPVGNMVSTAIPFVGIVSVAFETAGQVPDALFGKPRGAIKGEYAIGGPPPGSRGIPLPLMLRSIARVLGWRLAGRTWPHPFFDRSTMKPIFPVATLSATQREDLRPLSSAARSVNEAKRRRRPVE